MTLKKRLEAIRKGFLDQADAAVVEVMHGATQALVDSGQADHAVGEGDIAPDFSLSTTNGEPVSLSTLRARGPVVLTFFRGHW